MSIESIKLAYSQAKPLSGEDEDYPWPEPTPLPSTLPTVEAFHPSLLPAELRPWALDIAERMQCPIDFGPVGVRLRPDPHSSTNQ